MSSLSARLLVLTIFFIMLSELLIYAPSIARYRLLYLEDRVAAAHLATKALEAAADNLLSEKLQRELLFLVDAYSVTHRKPGRKTLLLSERAPPPASVTFDLREGNFVTWIMDAFTAMAQKEDKTIRVIGVPPTNPDMTIELMFEDAPLRKAMRGYSTRILQLSIVISLITGGLVYFSLQWLMVRPLRRITRSMTRFRENPEDAAMTARPSDRADEIGYAQRELAVMQNDLRAALQQKTRLATLGAAVAKVNHDLRNSLQTAVLASDKLADIDDPEVQRVIPMLYTAIDHAVDMCTQTLNYVSQGEMKLEKSHFHLQELAAEVGAAIRAAKIHKKETKLLNEVAFELDVVADRNQLFRALVNLARNAFQAGATEARISAGKDGGRVIINVADNGPGLSPKAEKNLFRPFVGSTRRSGAGIGLVIVRDILQAHGGGLELLKSDKTGATFRLEIPSRP